MENNIKKLLEYSVVWIVYHVVACAVASFISMEWFYLNINDWGSGGRFVYLFIGMIVMFAYYDYRDC